MLIKHTSIKWNLELFGEYIEIVDEEAEISVKSHLIKMSPLLITSVIDVMFEEKCRDIITKMSEFQERDSGWTLIRLMHLEVNINQYAPLKGSSYIPLPTSLLKKKTCNYVRHTDEFCFKWTIISSLANVNTSKRCSSYSIRNIRDDVVVLAAENWVLNFTGLKFPLPLTDIRKFEEMNPLISINLFGYDDEMKKIVGPYYITKKEKVEESWNEEQILEQDDDDKVERQKCVLHATNKAINQLNIQYFSKWKKLYRAAATFILYIVSESA